MKINILTKTFIIMIFFTMITKNLLIYGQGYHFDLTFNGSYVSSYTSTYKNTKISYGFDLGIPLNQFFELNIGETITKEIYIYNEEYRSYLISKGNDLPTGELTQEYNTSDTYTNLSLGLFSLYISPSIYAGIVNRQSYFKDYYGQETTEDLNLTWNAGAALSVRMGRHFRFKVTYRISPSGVNSPYGNPYYDQSYLVGLTISF